MNLFKAMATVAGLTGLSRIFGFIRDIMTAAILGAGPIADAFFVALKLPNFFRRVTAEGAFSVSFIPLYSERLETEGAEKADDFASNAFAVMVSVLVPFTVLAMVAMPLIIMGIAPGFQDDPIRYELAIELSRITFSYLLLMSLSALMGGVLNATNRFAPFAAAPVFFNLCLIIGLAVSIGREGIVGHALAWSVFAAGIVQFIWLLYCVKKAGIGLQLRKPALTADIKKLFALMGPGVLGAGVVHVNLFADLIIASFLPEGSISYLYYADRLNQLPLGMVGIAVGTALLPLLSKAVAGAQKEEAANLFNRALEVCFLFSLPAAVAFMAIGPELVAGLFQRGEFSAADAKVTGYVLTGYALGLPAYIASKVFSTVFWSHQDTMTPVKISIAVTISNIVLALILIQFIGVVGIAASTGIVGWMQFLLMRHQVKKIEGFAYDARFKQAFLKMAGSSVLMALILLVLVMVLKAHVSALALLLILVIGGAGVYGAGILLSGAVKPAELKRYFSKPQRKQ